MATTIDDGLSSGREGLSEGEIKPQKLKKMKNHLGLGLKYLQASSDKNAFSSFRQNLRAVIFVTSF